ncbi:hypothetical protein NPIL_269581, partial [Nephila pilipes]
MMRNENNTGAVSELGALPYTQLQNLGFWVLSVAYRSQKPTGVRQQSEDRGLRGKICFRFWHE